MADSQETIILQIDTATSEASLASIRKEIDLTKDSLASLKATMDEGGKGASDAAAEFEKQSSELRILQTDYKSQQRILDGYTQSVAANRDTNDLMNNSINTNRALLSQLTAAYNNVSNPAKSLTDTIRKVSDALKAQEGAIGDTRRNVGNYAQSFTDALSGIKAFGVSAGDVINPLKNLSSGFSAAGAAEGGFAEGLAGFAAGGGITAVIGLVSLLGKGLESLTSVANFTEDSIAGVKEGFQAFLRGDDISKAASGAEAYSASMRELNLQLANNTVEDAKNKNAVESLVNTSRDQTKNIDERIAALKEAAKVQKESSDNDLALAKTNFDTQVNYLTDVKGLHAEEVGILGEVANAETTAGQFTISMQNDIMKARNLNKDDLKNYRDAAIGYQNAIGANNEAVRTINRRQEQLDNEQRALTLADLANDEKFQVESGTATAESLIKINQDKTAAILTNAKLTAKEREDIQRLSDQQDVNITIEFANKKLAEIIKANQLQAQTTKDNADILIKIEQEKAQEALNSIQGNTSIQIQQRANIKKQETEAIAKIQTDAANQLLSLQEQQDTIFAEQIKRTGNDNTATLVAIENDKRQKLLNEAKVTGASQLEIDNINNQADLAIQKLNNADLIKILNDKIAIQKNAASRIQSDGEDASQLLIAIERQTQTAINADISKNTQEKIALVEASNHKIEDLERQHSQFEFNLQSAALKNELDALKNKSEQQLLNQESNAATLNAIDDKQRQIVNADAAQQLGTLKTNLSNEVQAVKDAVDEKVLTEQQGADQIKQLQDDASQQEVNIEQQKQNKLNAIDEAAQKRKESLARSEASALLQGANNLVSAFGDMVKQADQQVIDNLNAEQTAFDNQQQALLRESLKQFGLTQAAKDKLTQDAQDRQAAADAEFAAEKKAAALKQFQDTQAISIVQAVINTALAVTQALGSAPPPVNFVLAAIAAAAGAVEIGVISSQQPPVLAKGGGIDVVGNSHEAGGVPLHIGGRLAAEVEGGEKVFVLKKTASERISMLSAFNESFGGNSWLTNPVTHAASGGNINIGDGGFVARSLAENALDAQTLSNAIKAGFENAPSPVVSVVEINKVNAARDRSVKVSRL